MSAETLDLTPEVYAYLQKISLREAPVLQKLRHETQRLSGRRMQISPEQGQFMGLLMELLGAKKTLDIGTFTGYSALVVALALPQGSQVVTCDVDVEATSVASRFWQEAGVNDKISLCLGQADQTLQALIANGQENTFDFAFIDADKTNYDIYYELALKLLRQGGVIAIDNVLWSGKVADETVNDNVTRSMRALNAKLLKDERVTLSMIPIGDGLTLARKR